MIELLPDPMDAASGASAASVTAPGPAAATGIPKSLRFALWSYPEIHYRDWRQADPGTWTRAEKVMAFIEHFIRVPEGKLVGRPIRLLLFQELFIYGVYDNPVLTYEAYLSIARKNGKTATIAALLLAHICGPEARLNSQIVSGALSRDQAALVHELASKMINLNDVLRDRCRIVPSGKRIYGLGKNVEYQALSADAATQHGRSPVLAILDEIGQVKGPRSDFIDAVTTAQGAYDDPLLIAISTSAPSDADLFSVWCDDAARNPQEHKVCIVFDSDKDQDISDRVQWERSNPALGVFRAEADLAKKIHQAINIPSAEATVRNLNLNQRVARESLWLSPSVWKQCAAKPELQVFRETDERVGVVSVGLDLSSRQDLTAAVLAAKDLDGDVHLIPYCFTPAHGLKERARIDRAPYDVWVDQGYLIALPGKSLDYDMICEWLKARLDEEGVDIDVIEFDRWRIKDFKQAAEKEELGPYDDDLWHPVGQGFRDMSPRCEAFLNKAIDGKIRHGGHPLLTMAAANAIAVRDSANGIKLDKSKSTQRIDPLVAAVMAVYPITEGDTDFVSMYEEEGTLAAVS